MWGPLLKFVFKIVSYFAFLISVGKVIHILVMYVTYSIPKSLEFSFDQLDGKFTHKLEISWVISGL